MSIPTSIIRGISALSLTSSIITRHQFLSGLSIYGFITPIIKKEQKPSVHLTYWILNKSQLAQCPIPFSIYRFITPILKKDF
ncbi:hypothetical protein CEXT_105271 [Caerostris extrusa]|uniref:Uncharacterized protein n=1 Tax=Caerostris extrusa TaxID=172846 RepID=A0AAV4THE6_CAEEX|nr:hypothetical protein CEXT_105271 [Caerostris extrusa]